MNDQLDAQLRYIIYLSIYLPICQGFFNSFCCLAETKRHSSLFLLLFGSKFLVVVAACTLSIHELYNVIDAQLRYIISLLLFYMFRATLCSSSGGHIVLTQHLGLSGVQVLFNLHTVRSLTENTIPDAILTLQRGVTGTARIQ